MSLYENRVIGFIDILGWSDLIKNSTQNESLLKSIDSAASLIAEISQFTPQINQVSKQIANEYLSEGSYFENLNQADLIATHFSDTIVFSAPSNKENASILISCIIGLAIPLMRAGYYVRGSISKGQLHHTSNSLYGPALIKAHEMESKNAIYPRVILASDILEYVAIPEWINQDLSDGIHFLNVLWNSNEEAVSTIESALEINIRKNASDITKLQKLKWLKNYITHHKSKHNT